MEITVMAAARLGGRLRSKSESSIKPSEVREGVWIVSIDRNKHHKNTREKRWGTIENLAFPHIMILFFTNGSFQKKLGPSRVPLLIHTSSLFTSIPDPARIPRVSTRLRQMRGELKVCQPPTMPHPEYAYVP